jgi:5-methylcytosine-specific restriction endonuclease McrA
MARYQWVYKDKRYLKAREIVIQCDNGMCQDCIEGMRELPDNSIDLIVIDQSYVLNYKGQRQEFLYLAI